MRRGGEGGEGRQPTSGVRSAAACVAAHASHTPIPVSAGEGVGRPRWHARTSKHNVAAPPPHPPTHPPHTLNKANPSHAPACPDAPRRLHAGWPPCDRASARSGGGFGGGGGGRQRVVNASRRDWGKWGPLLRARTHGHACVGSDSTGGEYVGARGCRACCACTCPTQRPPWAY